MSAPTPCNDDIFKNGTSVMTADTGPTGGCHIFEEWVVAVAKKSGQPVDWHYSGGIAQVLALGDLEAVRVAMEEVPVPASITLWGGGARYRAGVDSLPDGVLGIG